VSDLIHDAEAAIVAIETAAERLAKAVRAEMELEDYRPIVKSQAIRRLMATENPETGKPHSASSAEKVCETDAEYSAHRRDQYAAVVETIRARAGYEVAKRRADLVIALIDVDLLRAGAIR
jgi:hypothetical protein